MRVVHRGARPENLPGCMVGKSVPLRCFYDVLRRILQFPPINSRVGVAVGVWGN
jgi:ABC-type uncharacterized transport system permease subunit